MKLILAFLWILVSTAVASEDCTPDALAKLVEPHVKAEEWKNWSLAQWKERSGKTLTLEVRGNPVRQTVLAYEDFSPPEKRLIQLILETSREKKYRRQNQRRYSQLEENIGGVADALGLERNELEAQVQRLARGEKVEIGAWIVETNSGKKHTALFTSSDTHELTEGDSQKAFDGLLRRHQIELADIKDVLMFHNHPVLAPASPGDSDAALALKLQLQRRGLNTGVWFYAICEVEQSTVVFHVGF